MNRVLVIFVTLYFLPSCGSSQDKSSKLRIDKDLHHELFDFMPYGVTGKGDKVFIDSVLVFSGDSTTDIQFISNANIIEINKKHLSFDTCRSYFYYDTLIVELKSINDFSSDKIIVKIRKKEFWTYLVNERVGISISGKPKSLVFKEEIKYKGQEIFGELIVDFPGRKSNQSYVFYGPFRCIVE